MSALRVPPVIALAAASAGVFLAALDQTAIVTILPPPGVMLDLKLTVTELDRAAWTITGYLLGYTVALPLMGRVSDIYGRQRVYLFALFLFGLGSVLAALAGSLAVMVAARAVQAVGGGATLPVTMALAADLIPGRRRAVALGAVGGIAEAGGVIGPLWGGAIAHLLGWRWVFWLNLPIIAMVALALLLPRLARPVQSRPVDYLGGLLLGGGLLLSTLALASLRTLGGAHMVMLAAGGLTLLLFARRQARGGSTLLPAGMVHRPSLIAANLTHLLVGGALILAMVNIPLMTDTVLGEEALEGGLRLLRLTAAIPVGAVLGGYLCRWLGYVFPTVVGLGLSAAGFLFMGQWSLQIADPIMTVHLVTTGLGFGLVIAPIAAAAINAVAVEDRGIAAALVALTRMVGMTLALAAMSSWGMGHFQSLLAGVSLAELEQGLTAAGLSVFHAFFRVGMLLCLAAMVPALFMRRGGQRGGSKVVLVDDERADL